jgi:hypothetical protein
MNSNIQESNDKTSHPLAQHPSLEQQPMATISSSSSSTSLQKMNEKHTTNASSTTTLAQPQTPRQAESINSEDTFSNELVLPAQKGINDKTREIRRTYPLIPQL